MVVEESLDGGSSYLLLSSLSASSNSTTIANLNPSTSYTFRVHAYNGTASADTAAASATTQSGSTSPAKPTAPSGLSATVASATQINLAWTNNDTSGTVTAISLEESTDGGTTYNQIASISPSATSYDVANNITPGASYVFRLQAHNGYSSGYSNTASATAFAVPAAPSSLSTTIVSPTQINLAWTNNDTSGTVTALSLEESINGGGFSQIASLSSSTASYDISGLTAGTAYAFRVQAHNGADSGLFQYRYRDDVRAAGGSFGSLGHGRFTDTDQSRLDQQ